MLPVSPQDFIFLFFKQTNQVKPKSPGFQSIMATIIISMW